MFLSSTIIRELALNLAKVIFILTFRHRASCILGQAFHYSPENAFYTRVVPKLMPPIYFHGNYTRYKEHNNTI